MTAWATAPPTPANVRPFRPEPFKRGVIHRRFARGKERPRGIVWFGIRSFWGHLQHFVASAIATEDVDSRDWMTPDEPQALAERVGRLLGAPRGGATLTERVGRDIWIDYLADSGDDVSVSRAVARLVFAPYELPDPDRPGAFLYTPRGDILLFGGDTAYPVATADEIRNRVIVPFNQILAERDDGQRRVLLAIPGNHDWYDGLDGFGRMFRRHVDYAMDGQARPTLHGSTRTLIGHYAEWAREFVRGGQVDKPKTLDLIGYTAAQAASYFVLPLAPSLAILGVDRQLKHVDSRQQHFFGSWLNEHLAASPWLVLPDPVYPFGEPSPTGFETIEALGLTLSARPHFVLSGDIHHYRRELDGPTMHVTAGGGGAFLHPAPLIEKDRRPALVEWPDRAQSRMLLRQVPWKVALGRSGIIPHLVLVVLLCPLAFADLGSTAGRIVLVVCTALMALLLRVFGGLRRTRRAVDLMALTMATLVTLVEVAIRLALESVLPTAAEPGVESSLLAVISVLAAVPLNAYLFGLYLSLLTRFGYENMQSFAALDHPGFKHFVRFRVRADGSAVDGWCVGIVDPAGTSGLPVLVDSFTWRSR